MPTPNGRPNKRAGSRRRPRLSADERRAQILDSAREVFLRSGASGARVKELADAAGVNPALLYQHFDSKEQLFEAAVLEPLNEAFETTIVTFPDIDQAEPRPEVLREATETYLLHLLQAMQQTGGLLGVVMFDDLEAGRTLFRERLQPMLDGLTRVVADYGARWKHADYDPEVAVWIAFGTCWMYAIQGHFGETEPADLERLAKQIGAIIFDGLNPR